MGHALSRLRSVLTYFTQGRTITKLMGGGGEVRKKCSRKGKLNEKNSRTLIDSKKIFMLWPTKNSFKKFLRLENCPPPPHNLSNGPSLMCHSTKTWNPETETETEHGIKYQ